MWESRTGVPIQDLLGAYTRIPNQLSFAQKRELAPLKADGHSATQAISDPKSTLSHGAPISISR